MSTKVAVTEEENVIPVNVTKRHILHETIYLKSLLSRHIKIATGTSLVVQWLRLHLPMQGVWV